MKKSILIVHNYYKIPGGEDTVVANEVEMLREHGHNVFQYTRNNSELDTMSIIQKLFLPLMMLFNIRTYVDIKRLIREHNIDVVHVHNTLTLISPAVYYAAIVSKVPVVQTIHNFRLLCPGATFYRGGHICEQCINGGLLRAIKYKCYRESRIQTMACVIGTYLHRLTGIYRKINYICLTEFNKNKLLLIKQIDEKKVYIKPNFVMGSKEYIPEEERLNQFIFAGRLDKLKGIDILFNAWKQMGKDVSNLIVCGNGPEKAWCEEFLERNECNISMKGFVGHEEVMDLVANSRGLILPTQWYEGFPMSIVEAFSVGTPVVCSDLGNAGSLIDEGVSGCKFKYDSVDELISAVNRCKGLCKSTYNVYRRQYTEEINYFQLINIYDNLQ